METSVDALFKKIRQSEQEAQNRKAALNELKQNIYTFQEKVKSSQHQCSDLKREYNKKLKELSEHEDKVREDDIQLGIYKQEKENLEQELELLKTKGQKLADTLIESKTHFCCDLEILTKGYGLRENGGQYRAVRQEECLQGLLEAEETLQKRINEYRVKEEEVAILLNQKEDLQHQLNESEAENMRFQSEFNTEVEKTLASQSEHQLTKDKLAQNLIGIQQAVMKEKESASELEQKCCNLQKELQSLQQKNWQKRVQKKQSFTHRKSKTLTTHANSQICAQASSSAQTENPPPFFSEDDLEMAFSDSEDFDVCVASESGRQNELTEQSNDTQLSTMHNKIFRH